MVCQLMDGWILVFLKNSVVYQTFSFLCDHFYRMHGHSSCYVIAALRMRLISQPLYRQWSHKQCVFQPFHSAWQDAMTNKNIIGFGV